MASDNTRWVDLKGIARISKADGNLYVRDMVSNRVTVTQLNRLVDIRTDLGEVFVKLDSGHAALTTLIHGFRFENKAARDKFVDDLMEVLTGNATYVDYPSTPKAISIDLTPTKKMTHSVAMAECQLYLNKLVDRWRNDHPGAISRTLTKEEAYAYACQPTDGLDARTLLSYVFDVEDVIITRTRRGVERPDDVPEAILFLEHELRTVA